MVVLEKIEPENGENAEEMVPEPVDPAPSEDIPEDVQPEENQRKS